MRGKRSEREEKDKEMVELTFESDESNSVVPCRKKRRTFLESFQTMTLSMSDNSSDDADSSCATGGSVNPSDDESASLDDDDDGMLSDQEKAHRAIMYQLVTGKTIGPAKTDVVTERIESLIRLTRLKCTNDDFNVSVQLQRDDADIMEVDYLEPIKFSSSLPQESSKQVVPGEPPIESVDVELPFQFRSF